MITFGELITKYGIPLPLPQAIYLWAIQLFGIQEGTIHGELMTIQPSAMKHE